MLLTTVQWWYYTCNCRQLEYFVHIVWGSKENYDSRVSLWVFFPA